MRFSEWEKDVAPKLMAAVTAAGDNKDAFNYLTTSNNSSLVGG